MIWLNSIHVYSIVLHRIQVKQFGLISFLNYCCYVRPCPIRWYGSCVMSYDCWNITLNTGAISLATNLRILVGSKSGQLAFDGFKSESTFSIPLEVNSRSDMGVTGLHSKFCKFPVGSLVKTDVYWLLKASAFSVGSLNMLVCGFRTGILHVPDFLCLM